MSNYPESIKKAGKALSNRKLENIDLSSLDFGKKPPQARDLEESVLGACMLENKALNLVIEILSPSMFYVEAHQHIYQAILDLFHKTDPVDIYTVTEQLRLNGKLEAVGGSYYVAELSTKVASGAHVEFHSRIIAQKFIQRELIRIASGVIKDAYDDTVDIFDLLDRAETDMFTIAEEHLKKNSNNLPDILASEIKDISHRMEKYKEGVTFSGVGSGFTKLDRITSGWQPSDLIILAARPGMGKTAFTLALARNAAIDMSKPIAFFSLEMDAGQIVKRLISMETELGGEKLREGNLEPYEWQQLTSRIDRLKEAPIYIDDTPALNIFELRAKCRRLKNTHDIQMVVIDYLQLMTAGMEGKSQGNREQEISQISRSLKSLAKELKIPVIALSQLSRAVETRGGDKRPMLSDLRESGAIEQDADMVVFLYRPEYYGLHQDEDGNDCRGIGEIIIAKHRNGSLGTVRAKFISQYAKFANLDDHTESPDAAPASVQVRSSRMNSMNEGFDDTDGSGGDTPF